MERSGAPNVVWTETSRLVLIRTARVWGKVMAKALSGSSYRMVALGFVAMFAASAHAQETTGQRQGQIIVSNKCSSCHAVGRFGESRNPKAPPFRTLHERYPIESLAEALAEGTISAASDEPEFNFSGSEVGAIISYISMIQEH
jgi:cytochrome c